MSLVEDLCEIVLDSMIEDGMTADRAYQYVDEILTISLVGGIINSSDYNTLLNRYELEWYKNKDFMGKSKGDGRVKIGTPLSKALKPVVESSELTKGKYDKNSVWVHLADLLETLGVRISPVTLEKNHYKKQKR